MTLTLPLQDDECPSTLRVPYSRDFAEETERQVLLDKIIEECSK